MNIVTPLTYTDALALVNAELDPKADILTRHNLARVLLRVDVASRDQARADVQKELRQVDAVAAAMTGEDDFVDSPTHTFTIPPEVER